jgi:hypothetical protein
MEPTNGSLILNYFFSNNQNWWLSDFGIFKDPELAVLYSFKGTAQHAVSKPSKYIRAKMCFCGANFSLL